MTAIAQATKAGGLRSGGDNHGAVIHVIDNPDNRHVYALGPALCGTQPRLTWSDWLPRDGKLCPTCKRKLDELTAAERAA